MLIATRCNRGEIQGGGWQAEEEGSCVLGVGSCCTWQALHVVAMSRVSRQTPKGVRVDVGNAHINVHSLCM